MSDDDDDDFDPDEEISIPPMSSDTSDNEEVKKGEGAGTGGGGEGGDGEGEEEEEEEVEQEIRACLVVGGYIGSEPDNSTEVYEVESNRFTEGPSLLTPRWGCTAVRLDNRRVLIAGGYDGDEYTRSTEIVNLKTMEVTLGPDMQEGRAACSSAKISENRIIVVGGYATDSTEIFDVRTMKWSWGPRLHSVRAYCGTALLDKRNLIVVGGYDRNGCPVASTEVFCADTAFPEPLWEDRNLRARAEEKELAEKLAEKERLKQERIEQGIEEEEEEEEEPPGFDELALDWGRFVHGPLLSTPRAACAAASPTYGFVVVVGGFDGKNRLDTIEIVRAESIKVDGFRLGPRMRSRRSGCVATKSEEYCLLVVGGTEDSATGSPNYVDVCEMIDLTILHKSLPLIKGVEEKLANKRAEGDDFAAKLLVRYREKELKRMEAEMEVVRGSRMSHKRAYCGLAGHLCIRMPNEDDD